MSESPRPEHDLTAPEPAPDLADEDRLRQFERDWLAGRRPVLDDYLAGSSAGSHGLLVELAQIDLEFRIKAGEPTRAGDYLARYPQLAADLDVAADLIASEFDLRRRNEPTLSFNAVASNYPQYLERLDRHPARLQSAREERR